MNERDFYRQVARATGDTMGVISSHGFVPLDQTVDDDEPTAIDWDQLQHERTVSVMPPRLEATA